MFSPVTARMRAAQLRWECGRNGGSARSVHSNAGEDAAALVQADSEARSRLGPVQIAGVLGQSASTAHSVLVCCRINPLYEIAPVVSETGRRSERDRAGSLIHVDGHHFRQHPDGGDWALRSFISSSTTTPASPTPRSTRTRRKPPRSISCTIPSPSSPSVASPSNASSQATVPHIGCMPGDTPLHGARDPPKHPLPARRLTVRSSGRQRTLADGWTHARFYGSRSNVEQRFPAGSTTTIITDATPQSEPRSSVESKTTSLDITSS